jgi:hypothetical protein
MSRGSQIEYNKLTVHTDCMGTSTFLNRIAQPEKRKINWEMKQKKTEDRSSNYTLPEL